jgi:phosphoribosylformylglycinamidine cyclo-ligase
MPGFYGEGEYDIAGTIVGVVDEDDVIDGSRIVEGDCIIGLASNGLHTNGYSLARKIVSEIAGKSYADPFEPTGRSFGEELLRPHRAYTSVGEIMAQKLIKGCAHITGGGFQENIDRIIPENCNADIDTSRWDSEPVFKFLQNQGKVENDEMYRTFNMGIGMVLVVAAENRDTVLASVHLAQFNPVCIGEITAGNGSVRMKYE